MQRTPNRCSAFAAMVDRPAQNSPNGGWPAVDPGLIVEHVA
jgi:hypothetical protein